MTYVPTATVVLYLAVVLDAWSRRIVGRAMATHLRTELVLDALDMALRPRCRNAGVRFETPADAQLGVLDHAGAVLGVPSSAVHPPRNRGSFTATSEGDFVEVGAA